MQHDAKSGHDSLSKVVTDERVNEVGQAIRIDMYPSKRITPFPTLS